MRKKRSIRVQFMVAFTLVAILIIGSISFMTLQLVNRHFDRYVDERQKDVLVELTSLLEKSYDSQTMEWDEAAIQQVERLAQSEGIDLTVYDVEGALIWQRANDEDKGMHMNGGMMNSHSKMMNQMMQEKNGIYVEKEKKLKVGNREAGRVTFGYYGPLSYTTHDVTFITELRKNLLWIAIGTLIFVLLFANWIAKRLSAPILKLTQFTEKIAKGNYRQDKPPTSSASEIQALIVMVQSLAVQLDAQQTLRNQLSSDISHEIRTPLTTLKGQIEAMLDGIWEPTRERLESCYEEVNRLSRLIGEIDKITALEMEQEELIRSSFDLFQLAKRLLLNSAPLMQEKQLEVSLVGEAVTVYADQDKISQVIMNLLTNAVKFTNPFGQITVQIGRTEDTFFIVVKDNGIGIAAADLNQIFQRFYMVDSSRNSEGQGIGLAIVKSIANAHGGYVEVASKENEGATFKVVFPLLQAPQSEK